MAIDTVLGVGTTKEQPLTVLERGDIYFFYWPKAGTSSVNGVSDVQHVKVILRPYQKPVYRLIIIGRKRLPAPERPKDQCWGLVENVTREPEEMSEELAYGPGHTGGREGRGRQSPARPAGEGVYVLARHGDHVHLVYALELPEEPGEVQRALHIVKNAAYLISVRPADQKWACRPGQAVRVQIPKSVPYRPENVMPIMPSTVDPSDALDRKGTEIILMTGEPEIIEALSLALHPQHEVEATAEIFDDLQLRPSRHPLEPLFQGKWR